MYALAGIRILDLSATQHTDHYATERLLREAVSLESVLATN